LSTSFIKSTTLRRSEVATSSIRPKENTLAPGDRSAGFGAALSSKKISPLVAKALCIRHSVAPLLSVRSGVFAAGDTIFTDVTVSAGLNARMNSLPMIYSSGGTKVTIDQITVKWPSGLNQILSNISANQEVTVIEGQ